MSCFYFGFSVKGSTFSTSQLQTTRTKHSSTTHFLLHLWLWLLANQFPISAKSGDIAKVEVRKQKNTVAVAGLGQGSACGCPVDLYDFGLFSGELAR